MAAEQPAATLGVQEVAEEGAYVLSFNLFVEKMHTHFDAHPERLFITKSLIMVFTIIITKTIYSDFIFYIMLSNIFIGYVAYRWIMTNTGIIGLIREHFSFIPAPRSSTKDRLKETEWVTWTIIIINVYVYLFLTTSDSDSVIAFAIDRLIFLPKGQFTVVDAIISMITSMYLHADIMHLLGNMCFLWAAGTIVERRIGWKRYLLAYHLSGFASCILAFLVYFGVMNEDIRMLGASGAISGVMGVYIVRCYFKKMDFPIPLFGLLPIYARIQLNSFVVMGLFFVMDVESGVMQIVGYNSRVAAWAHVGGMLAGMTIAWFMKLQIQAVEERYQERGSSVIDGNSYVTSAFLDIGGLDGAKKSLKVALDKNPHNLDTILALARIESRTTDGDHGRGNYQKVIVGLLDKNPRESIAVFREYFAQYREIIEPEAQFRIASLLYKDNDLDLAARTLEMLSSDEQTPDNIREKSMFMAAKILDKMGLVDAAKGYYQRFTEMYPMSDHAPFATEQAKVK